MLDKFGEKLKKVREERKISQRSLGLFLGLSDKAISSYESGRNLPSLETLIKISEELKKPITYFLDYNFVNESMLDKINEIELEINNISENLKDIKKSLAKSEKRTKVKTPSVTPEL